MFQAVLCNYLRRFQKLMFGYHIYIIIAGAQLMRGLGSLFYPFFKIGKKVYWFWEKCPDCVYLWNKFLIQNVVLRVFKRKNSKNFPCGALITFVLDEMFIEVSLFQEISSTLKNSSLHSCVSSKYFWNFLSLKPLPFTEKMVRYFMIFLLKVFHMF